MLVATQVVAFIVSLFIATHAQAMTLQIAVHYPTTNLNQQPLFLRGDKLGLNWNEGIPLEQIQQNLYTITLNYTQNDIGSSLEMKVLVADQQWQIGQNEQIIIPSQFSQFSFYPFFFTNQGRYDNVADFYSPELKNYRDLVVYVPPSYDENPLKKDYPVLVMHDGQNLFNASTSFGGVAWRCQDTVDLLINQGTMPEIIMFGLDNTGAQRIYEYTYSYDQGQGAGGKGDFYLDFLEKTALPWLLNNYRGSPNPSTTGILGSSLGGLISCYAGWTRQRYGRIGCMSSSFWWNNEDFNGIVMQKKPANKQNIFYLDSGNQGPGQDDIVQTTTVRKHMQQLGWNLDFNLDQYIDQGGQHSEYFWGKRFWSPMGFLYPIKPTQPDL